MINLSKFTINLLMGLGYLAFLSIILIASIILSNTIINLIFLDFAFLGLESTRTWLAIFIVAFPIFVICLRHFEKNNQIPNWAKAIAFFTSMAIIILFTILILSSFFEEGLTNIFILKSIMVLVLALLVLGYNINNQIAFIARIPNRIKIVKQTTVIIGVVCIFWVGSLIDILHAKDIETDKVVVNAFANAVSNIDDRLGSISPSKSEVLNTMSCFLGSCFSFPSDRIVYKKIDDSTFSLCGEIKTSISIKLIIYRLILYEHKLIDWDGETACFEVPYPITKDYSRGALYY